MVEKDIKEFFKFQHKDSSGARQHVSKDKKEGSEMLRASMAQRTDKELEQINYELRQFDLNVKYGPVSGLSRSQRWQRASALKLDPPVEIKDYLEDEHLKQQIPNLENHLWCGLIDIDFKKQE